MGTVIGSFLSVCIYRLPRKESIIIPRSFCPICKEKIKLIDNIPILSYILLRGKCRYCESKISLRYLLVEILTGILYFILWRKYGLTIEMWIYLILISSLVVVTFIDIDYMIIPDVISLPLICVGVIMTFIRGDIVQFLVGGAIGGGILYLLAVISEWILHKEGMGCGDIKLATAIGLFIGWEGIIKCLFLACLIGAIVGVILIINGWKKRGEHIPFGPYLAIATIIVIFSSG